MQLSFFFPSHFPFFPPGQPDRQVPTGNSQIRFFSPGGLQSLKAESTYIPLFFFAHFDWHHYSNVGEPKGLVMLESRVLTLEKMTTTYSRERKSHTNNYCFTSKKKPPKFNAVAPNYEGQDFTIRD